MRWRDDRGFAICTILLITGIASAIIVGGSKTAASVYDREITHEATGHLRHVADGLRDAGEDVGGAEGAGLQDRARRMTEVANLLDDQATDRLVSDVVGNAGDALLIPLQGGAVVEAVKAAWDVKGYLELGGTAVNAYTPTDPTLVQGISDLQDLDPIDVAVVEAKVRAAKNAVQATDPAHDEAAVEEAAIAALLALDESEIIPGPPEDPFDNPAWDEIVLYVGVPEVPASTTTTATTTTIAAGRPAEPLRLTWAYEELADGHDLVTFSIENVSGETIEGIHFWNLDLPGENWTPAGPPWTLEPGEVIAGTARFRVSYYGLASWDVATGLYASDWEDAYSNGIATDTGEDYPWEEHLMP
ncbi:MAG: hypothetical protein KQH83_04630 [Actinobacteria bacterium]|nr:hypothetical protein [Actinomycetota bacterium]